MAVCCNGIDPWERISMLEREIQKRDEELKRHRIAEAILNNAAELVFVLDRHLNFVYANPRTIAYGTRVLQCSKEAFLRKTLVEIAASDRMLGSDIYQQNFNDVRQLFEAPRSLYFESNVRFQGRLMWLGAWVVPVFDDAGEVISVAATARNITEQVESRTALADEKERLAVTLASVGDAVITTDLLGCVTTLNIVAERLTGWAESAALGRSIDVVFRTFDENTRTDAENPVRTLLARVDNIEPFENNDKILVSKDGRETQISSTCAPIRHGEKAVIGAVLVFRDVSKQKATEEEMHRVQKLESVGILAGGIAHDFNNILTSVMGNLSLAQRRAKYDQGIYERLVDAEKAVSRARGLTNQLLTFSKGGAPIKTLASVQAIVEESACFSIIGSPAKLVMDIPDDLWRAEVDEGQIAQVIQNLVINAVQAMPDGGKVHISIENCFLDADSGLPLLVGQYVLIRVADQGIGIPPSILDRVFDPYFTTKKDGTGLGLATTHSIVRRHGGHITVESKEMSGTCFSIYLPATEERITNDFVQEFLPDLKQGRILVMDDEANIREVASAILRELGFEVDIAKNGEEAVARYTKALRENRRFDAVIMDLTVPGGIGGRECLARLKAVDPSVKAVVSSGYSNDPTMSEFHALGFAGRVAKPYGVDELVNVLRRVLGG